jgi:hypothetical protein
MRGSRWLVHLGLIGTASVSLMFEPMLTLHLVTGLAFVVLVGAHLLQRRRVSAGMPSPASSSPATSPSTPCVAEHG